MKDKETKNIEKEKLIEAGIDVSDAMDRLLDNYEMFSRFVKRFPTDENYKRMLEAVVVGDCERAFRASHTLKGVCANMSMNELRDAVSVVVECFRSGDLEGGRNNMSPVIEKYNNTVKMVKEIYSL